MYILRYFLCLYILNHSSIKDILLAKDLLALSPSGQKENPIASQHGVDLILGGHDHLYFVGRGVSSWDNFNISETVLGAELDNGDVLVIKSGTDFRDLSAINIVLESTPKGSVRNKIVKLITGSFQKKFTHSWDLTEGMTQKEKGTLSYRDLRPLSPCHLCLRHYYHRCHRRSKRQSARRLQ